MTEKKRILILTSHNPFASAGLAMDMVYALEGSGYEVDVLIRNPFEGQPSNVHNIFNQPVKQPLSMRFFRYLRGLTFLDPILEPLRKIRAQKKLAKNKKEGNVLFNTFTYPDELNPGVNVQTLLNHIDGDYTAVIALYWESYLTSESLKHVYQKVKCPILMYSVDMSTMTGGCFYFGKCRNMFKGCGNCPQLGDSNPNDASRRNFIIKKDNYHSMPCVLIANTWMNNFARKTSIIPENQILDTSIIINDVDFSPSKNQQDLINIPEGKNFVISFRSDRVQPRKGGKYVIELMHEVWNRIPEKQRSRILLISIGTKLNREQKKDLKFDILDLGYVGKEDLIKVYRTSSVFLSPSTDDAGPSMVNQAMLCGTPVFSFNIGTALDVIDGKGTGIMAPLGDIEPWVEGIIDLMGDRGKLDLMSKRAREVGLEMNSYEAFVRAIETAIERVKDWKPSGSCVTS